MWKKWKESKLFKKMKEVRINRAVYLSAIVILLTLAVILAVTAALNRAKKTELTTPTVTDSAAPDRNDQQVSPTPDDSAQTGADAKVPELALPTSGILLKEHSVDVQVFSQTMKDYRVHLGVDIACAANAPVCAAADGTVAQIWEDPMMGWCVAINHAGECVTVYKNLAKDLADGLAVGATVLRGQLLGQVGDTALLEIAEEPHLHMEMTVKGLQVDPLDYFSESVLNTLTEDDVYETEIGK